MTVFWWISRQKDGPRTNKSTPRTSKSTWNDPPNRHPGTSNWRPMTKIGGGGSIFFFSVNCGEILGAEDLASQNWTFFFFLWRTVRKSRFFDQIWLYSLRYHQFSAEKLKTVVKPYEKTIFFPTFALNCKRTL